MFMSIAAIHPFVMHSILAFSASHLAWISQLTETQDLAFRHASIALEGMREAASSFTNMNSDAVLASSLLLGWVATDWACWASRVTETEIILRSMQSWRHKSLFADYIAEHILVPSRQISYPICVRVSQEAHAQQLHTLLEIYGSLQRMEPYLSRDDQETNWVDQLKVYLDRIRASSQAQTPEEQFNQLYALRKWLFWVPISLLDARRRDIKVLCALAHLYATALALEPMFQEVACVLVSDCSLLPLEEILTVIQRCEDPGHESGIWTVLQLIQCPLDIVSSYKNRRGWMQRHMATVSPSQQPFYPLEYPGSDLEAHGIAMVGSIDPASHSPRHLLAPYRLE